MAQSPDPRFKAALFQPRKQSEKAAPQQTQPKYSQEMMDNAKQLMSVVRNLYTQASRLNRAASKLESSANNTSRGSSGGSDRNYTPIFNKILKELGLIRRALQNISESSKKLPVSEKKGATGLVSPKQPEPLVKTDKGETEEDKKSKIRSGTGIQNVTGSAFMGMMGQAFAQNPDVFIDLGKKIFDNVVQELKTFWTWVKKQLTNAWDFVVNKFEQLVDEIKRFFSFSKTANPGTEKEAIESATKKYFFEAAMAGGPPGGKTLDEYQREGIEAYRKQTAVAGLKQNEYLKNELKMAAEGRQVVLSDESGGPGLPIYDPKDTLEIKDPNETEKTNINTFFKKFDISNKLLEASATKNQENTARATYLSELYSSQEEMRKKQKDLEGYFTKNQINKNTYEKNKKALEDTYNKSFELITKKYRAPQGVSDEFTKLQPNEQKNILLKLLRGTSDTDVKFGKMYAAAMDPFLQGTLKPTELNTLENLIGLEHGTFNKEGGPLTNLLTNPQSVNRAFLQEIEKNRQQRADLEEALNKKGDIASGTTSSPIVITNSSTSSAPPIMLQGGSKSSRLSSTFDLYMERFMGSAYYAPPF